MIYNCHAHDTRPFSVHRVATIAHDLCAALELLASYGIVHGDIAARNVFVTDSPSGDLLVKVVLLPCLSTNTFQIGDFGFEKEFRQVLNVTEHEPDRALLRWHSPELLKTRQPTGASDVWSFGVLVW